MNIYRSIYHSKGPDTHWLEIDSASIRIPFNEVSEDASDYNVVLFNRGVLAVSLYRERAKEFMELWDNKDNKDNKD
jgi:hypothetical protein